MLGKILETHWELKRNIVRTHWEVRINEKKSFLPPPQPQNIKGKKTRHLECMFGLSHWLNEISLFKRFHHHFWHGLMALTKNTSLIQCWGTFDF